MPQIGAFTVRDGRYSGFIRTLTVNAKIRLEPTRQKGPGEPKADAPDYRVYSGVCELGAAWRRGGESGGTPYLSVELDDPSFPAPIRAALFENEREGTAVLVWKRPKPDARSGRAEP